MANTYTLIASNTLSTSASSITFSSIPATYTDLVLRLSARGDRAVGSASGVYITINGITTSTYSYRSLYGNGTSAASDNSGSVAPSAWGAFLIDQATSTANTFGNSEIYFPNYAGSSNKSMSIDSVYEQNGTDAYAYFTAGLWSNTAAITSVKLEVNSGTNFVQYSNFYLYGIKNS
jgi:hypothetical protein